jgi:hypothetical protein
MRTPTKMINAIPNKDPMTMPTIAPTLSTELSGREVHPLSALYEEEWHAVPPID